MSLKKITLPNGDQKWEVRLYENGRGSTRITRRFDRKVDADAFELEYKEQQKKKKPNYADKIPVLLLRSPLDGAKRSQWTQESATKLVVSKK